MRAGGQMVAAPVSRLDGRSWRLLLALIGLLLAPFAPPAAGAASQTLAPPEISAEAAILVDLTAGRVIAERAAHQRRAIASLTKVMTAVVALRYGSLSDEVIVEGRDLPGEASIGLKPGDRFTLETLLYGMLMRSGNDAAAAVARAVGEKVAAERGLSADGAVLFITLMNQEAVRLGMVNTRFVNPHGLDAPNQYSTAYDLALLTRHALENPIFAQIFQARSYPFRASTWTNVNRLLDQYDGLVGGKTGIENQAGLCLIEVAQRGAQRLVVVVLNAPQWYADARAWLDYGFGEARLLPSLSLPLFGEPATLTGAPLQVPTPLAVPTPTETPRPPSTPAPPTVAPVAAVEPARGAGEVDSTTDLAPVRAQVAEDGSLWMIIGLSALALVVLVGLVGLTLRTMGVGPWGRPVGMVRTRPVSTGAWRIYQVGSPREPMAGRSSSGGDGTDQDEHTPPDGSEAVPRAASDEPAPDTAPDRPTRAARSQTDEMAVAHVALAVRYVSEGRLESAVTAFVKAIQAAPEYRFTTAPALWTIGPEGMLTLATAYLRCNRLVDARAVVALGLITFPDDPELRELDARLRQERRRSGGGGGRPGASQAGPRGRGTV